MAVLPKGIVVNARGAVKSIDRIDSEPLDQADIAKLWKVYTTTQRRLLDPTAERLENLWWRIWGSRKKQLKASVVARLFAQVSDGLTFVPLRGPPGRDEGHQLAESNIRYKSGDASSTTTLHRQNESRPSTTCTSAASRAPVSMPPPILKKARGPSTTGPRPTARFISPAESLDESEVTSPTSPNSHVVVQPPSAPASPSTDSQDAQEAKTDRKSTASGKKKAGFVASAGKKRRPVIVRRQSSQSSYENTKKDNSQPVAGTQAVVEKSTSSVEQSRKQQSKFRENFSSGSDRSPVSKGSMIKASASQITDTKSSAVRTSYETGQMDTVREHEGISKGDPGPSRRPGRMQNDREHSPTAEELEEIEVQRALLEQANAKVKRQQAATETAAHGQRHTSRALESTLRSRSDGNLSTKGKAKASLAPTIMAAASGKMELSDSGSSDVPSKSRSSSASLNNKGKNRDSRDIKSPDMFPKRRVDPLPAITSPEATDKLSRSRSQLTLLLERDRARTEEKKPEKGKGKGVNRGGSRH